MDTTNQRVRVQIFATDIDGRAVDHARKGVYPASIAADVSEARLARFFIQEPGGGTYRVCKPIRDMLVVSRSRTSCSTLRLRLDLLSCRNVLIFMGSELQEADPAVSLCPEPGGIPVAGRVRNRGDCEHGDLFATVDRQTKLYRSEEGRKGMRRPSFGEPGGPRRNDPAPAGDGLPAGDGARPSLRELVERTLLSTTPARRS